MKSRRGGDEDAKWSPEILHLMGGCPQDEPVCCDHRLSGKDSLLSPFTPFSLHCSLDFPGFGSPCFVKVLEETQLLCLTPPIYLRDIHVLAQDAVTQIQGLDKEEEISLQVSLLINRLTGGRAAGKKINLKGETREKVTMGVKEKLNLKKR